MSNTRLLDYFTKSQENFLHNCTECGNCVTDCYAVQNMQTPPDASQTVRGIKDCLSGGTLNEATLAKTTACMGCYGCVDMDCPIGLDSLLLNQLVWRTAELAKEEPFFMPLYVEHQQKLQDLITPAERARITTPVFTQGAEFVFFPGCNIYLQPDKVLNAMDLMDAVGIAYSFIPGMEYCCGLPRGNSGDADWLQERAESLIAKAVEFGAKTMICWCATCLCNMEYRIKKFADVPFALISFGKYLADHTDRLSFPNAQPQTVTLHEPCKSAYMGIDMDDVRDLLRAVPGTELVEMAHYGADTMCCGCRAINTMPEFGKSMTDKRLDEALDTGAEKMIDVCHTCHLIFRNHSKETGRNDVVSENYTTYLMRALGHPRADSLD